VIDNDDLMVCAKHFQVLAELRDAIERDDDNGDARYLTLGYCCWVWRGQPVILLRKGGLHGDLPQNDGAAGACGRGEIAGFVLPCAVGEDGEGDGFFGVGIDVELGLGGDPAVGKERRELGHELAVVNAAACRDEFLCRCRNCSSDGGPGECGGGRDEVLHRETCCDEAVDKVRAILFATGGFGWLGFV